MVGSGHRFALKKGPSFEHLSPRHALYHITTASKRDSIRLTSDLDHRRNSWHIVRMVTHSNIEIVFAWYDPAEWTAWRAACEDGETFFRTDFETWKLIAESTIAEQERAGLTVHRIPIRLAEFLKWAEEFGKGTNTQFRSEYAAYAASRQVR